MGCFQRKKTKVACWSLFLLLLFVWIGRVHTWQYSGHTLGSAFLACARDLGRQMTGSIPGYFILKVKFWKILVTLKGIVETESFYFQHMKRKVTQKKSFTKTRINCHPDLELLSISKDVRNKFLSLRREDASQESSGRVHLWDARFHSWHELLGS